MQVVLLYKDKPSQLKLTAGYVGKAHSWARIPKCMAGLGYHHLVKHKVNGIMILNLCRL
jgi:hypothetical protein